MDTEPLLDELCGFHASLGREQTEKTFFKSASFPILAARIVNLQEYMRERKPDNLIDMVRDWSDIFLWYNYWPAIILAIVALLLTLISTVATLIQTHYAILSYQMQVNATSSGSESC